MTMSRGDWSPWRRPRHSCWRPVRAAARRRARHRPRRRRAPASAESAAPSEAAGEPVTITWYHIQNNDPGLSLWQDLADEYTAAHPNVTIDIQVNENEAFKTKLTTLLQQGDVPDLFQTWGGGGLRQQVEAGLVKDITADIARRGRTRSTPAPSACTRSTASKYGMPFDLGLVGFWYNTKTFEEAGITAPPATWDEFLTDRPDAQGQGHHPDRPRPARTPGPARSTGRTSRSATAARRAWTRPSPPVTGPIRASSRPARTSRS